ncbi:MAG: BrnT family toxin [Patescibacteria group bacterium]|nr:BrnT family toxin [Patescibacteria group bacterium]
MVNLSQIQGFDWDDGNAEKNWAKHKVTPEECEKIFKNKPLNIFYDQQHSQKENRFVAFGTINNKKLLTVAFIIRNNKIRIISARNQSRKERKIYAKN